MDDPKKTFHFLLELSGITKVYFIDDYLDMEFNPENALALAVTLIADNKGDLIISSMVGVASLNGHLNISTTPHDEIVNTLRVFFDNGAIDAAVKKDASVVIYSLGDENYLKEIQTISKIVDHFPVAQSVHPSLWDSIKDGELEKDLANGKILILVDKDLSKAEGFANRNGVELIKELKKKSYFGQISCILISHDILNAKDELSERSKLVGGDLTEKDFFALSKKRLDVDDHFYDGIKKALINGYFESIKEHTTDLIQESYKDAIAKIKEFDTYDFDDIIVKKSLKEGIWPPETIVRISNIIFERSLKKRMVSTNYALKVNKEFREAQKFSSIDFPIMDASIEPYVAKLILRHDETYDPGDIINPLRKPLENGDIFQLHESKYILVAQACDIIVRASGNKKGIRNAKTATLLKIDEKTLKKYKQKLKDEDHYLKDKFPLNYFKSGSTAAEVGVADFTNFLIVDIDFLDLCVLNAEGKCKFDLNSTDNIKEYLSPSWEFRYDILLQKLKQLDEKLQGFKKQLRPRGLGIYLRRIRNVIPKMILNRMQMLNYGSNNLHLEKELYPKIILASSQPIESPITFEKDVFDFAFTRITKYKDSGATYLLDRYTRHLSRIAEPLDFAEAPSPAADQMGKPATLKKTKS